MKLIIRKFTALAVSSVMALGMASSLPFSYPAQATEDGVILQAECEELEGATLWTSIYEKQFPGYSGEGFAYLTNETITVEVEVPEDGMYEFSTRCVQVLSEDGREQTLAINGTEFMYKMPYYDTWTDFSFGIHRLKKGTNTIQLLPKYGYGAYDTLTIKKAVLPELNVQPTLSDADATKETQGLMNYLCDVYGEHMLSGQQEIYGGGHTQDSPGGYSGEDLQGYETEFEWIKKNFGDYPAIRGFDMMNYNPLYGWDDGTTERMIEWGTERNGIPTLCWHINVPKDFANYTLGEAVDWTACTYKPDETDFDTTQAIIEGTKENEYFKLAIADLAEQLLLVQEAGVPIIFRPLHEAEGNSNLDGSGSWFWWGKGGSEVYKQLWQLLHTTLTEEYGVHNLIWEYNSYDYSTSPSWYPGDEWVDIVGYDKYNCIYNRHDGNPSGSGPNEDAISSTFYTLVDLTDGNKLVSMPENDTVPSLDNIMVEQAYWLYFCIWYDNGSDNFLSGTNNNDPETLKEMYQSDYCITLSELPDWKNYTSTGSTTEPTEPTSPTEPTEPTEPTAILGDLDNNGVLNVVDAMLMRRYLLTDTASTDASYEENWDWNEDGQFSLLDLIGLTKFLLRKS